MPHPVNDPECGVFAFRPQLANWYVNCCSFNPVFTG